MEREDRVKKLESALRGYANRNLILAMENKRLIEENEGLKKVLKILEERVIENGEEASMLGFFFILNCVMSCKII
ncbi:hypothetical protein [Clostridium paraputrificum]|uniref:hypothetical protein n=1 Tax=Clostridium paraputrificum TaxID=29363 RepID=UPI000665F640|nr:hypothetical protein [Clostridium paraputrificum]